MLTQVLRAFSLVSGIRKISQRSRLQTENIDPDECQLLRHAIQSVDREHDLPLAAVLGRKLVTVRIYHVFTAGYW